MDSKFFDIPFLSQSLNSDFDCPDGEIIFASATGNNADSFESQPPVPKIEFALVRDVLPGWNILPDSYPSKTLVASDPTMEYWTSLASQLLAQFKSEAEQQNLFVAPFYVMAVWRTSAGDYLSPSSRILMIPNSAVPLVSTAGDIRDTDVEFRITAALGHLHFRVQRDEILRDFVGKILSLDIFVSQPLHSYNSFRAFIPYRNLTTDSYCRCLDTTSGKISDQIICTERQPLAWKALLNRQDNLLSESLNDSELENFPDSLNFYKVQSVPLKEIDALDEWTGILHHPAWFRSGYNGEKFSYKKISEKELNTKSIPLIIEGEGKVINVVTRPLKLSGAGIFKRVSSIYLRGNYNPEAITIKVYGSRDMLSWHCVSIVTGSSVIGLPHSYFRFFKVGISGLLETGENLQGLTIIERSRMK